jgi:hypothetical protein
VLLKEKHARQKNTSSSSSKKQTSSRRNDYWLDTFQMRSFEKKKKKMREIIFTAEQMH